MRYSPYRSSFLIGLLMLAFGGCEVNLTTDYLKDVSEQVPVCNMLIEAGEVPACTLTYSRPLINAPDTIFPITDAEVSLLLNDSASFPMSYTEGGVYLPDVGITAVPGDQYAIRAILPSGDSLSSSSVLVPARVGPVDVR
ncbi:MAG: DUF4249 family protein, partial [Bacteroidota bacterium]